MSDADRHPTPEGYQRHVITHVEGHGDGLMIRYGGRVFCGVMLDELPPGIVDGIRPGVDVIVRCHTDETGYAGTVAHMLIPHPTAEGWAEIYADY
jgi:hypothetical protein